ncbi:MAG TPA: hypothetical protein PK771_15580, partial [Spirochaetota bacterium]|nr:hypothetical protein [Spirochaetota bacterium]
MGLLKRAVQYREELSLTKPKGLLAKALSFIESRNKSNLFPKADVGIIEEDLTDKFEPKDLSLSEDFISNEISGEIGNISDNIHSDGEISTDFFNEVSMDFNNEEIKEDINEDEPHLLVEKATEVQSNIDTDIQKI